MKVKDIIKDDKFNEFLGYEIEAYNNRPAPQEGCRYRRTPYDALKDAGIFTVEGIRETFIKVANLESGLPKSQRDILVREDWLKAYSAMDYDKFIAAVKTGAKQELPTCRTCKHRQRWELNDHSTKIVQSCALQKSRRTGNGLKRIKVTNPACRLYEKE